jgi:formylglycine-generating enzyme required for sulfatase activity
VKIRVLEVVLSYNRGPTLPETHTLRREEAALKTSILHFVIIVLLSGSVLVVSTAQGILHEDSQLNSISASKSSNRMVRKSEFQGSGVKRAAAFLQAAAAETLPPLSKQQLLDLINAGVTNQRAAELIRDRGIDFQADEDYIRSLRRAGANDVLITALRKKSVPIEGITVETEPNAQVFLDGNPQGQADSQGMLVIRAKVGSHTIKVSEAGKRDFQQTVALVDGQPVHIVAPLTGLAGSLRVKAPVGAIILMDNSIRGTVDPSGELLIGNIPPGVHTMRVTAHGKVDDARDIGITAGMVMPVEVTLADSVRTNPQDGLKYVWIAPGRFLMGCSPGDVDCATPEKPAHPVTLSKAYWIGQTEVTVGAYKQYVAAAKIKMPPAPPKRNRGWKIDTLPIVNLSWDEAGQYCTWAGGRLPTEAEWEYASRGSSAQARYGNLDDIAWSRENAESQSHPVGGKKPNEYGLFDTLGNVWEWVNDWYDPNYYQTSPTLNPTGPATGEQKGLRGGSWIVDSKLLRVSDRYSIQPAARSDFFGFRCVWEPKAP